MELRFPFYQHEIGSRTSRQPKWASFSCEKKMVFFCFSKSYSPLAKKRKQSPKNDSDNLLSYMQEMRIRSTTKVRVSKPKMASNLHLVRS